MIRSNSLAYLIIPYFNLTYLTWWSAGTAALVRVRNGYTSAMGDDALTTFNARLAAVGDRETLMGKACDTPLLRAIAPLAATPCSQRALPPAKAMTIPPLQTLT